MAKYAQLRHRIETTLPEVELLVPPAIDDKALRRAHDPLYLRRVIDGALDPKDVRRMGFPWSPQLVERSRRSVGGTVAACRVAVEETGIAACLAGGTHHAFADRGEGFCVFNDAAVAARSLQAETAEKRASIERVLIVDCDVHQGNGTAAIFARDPSVFTFSIHGRRNYPFHKETSDLDIELEDGTGDAEYLDALDTSLDRILSIFGADLVIYLAGADPYEHDRLGRLALTKEGLDRRDRLVLDRCRDERLPVAVVMAGGYAPEVEDIVDIHFNTIRRAAELKRSS